MQTGHSAPDVLFESVSTKKTKTINSKSLNKSDDITSLIEAKKQKISKQADLDKSSDKLTADKPKAAKVPYEEL